jgi:rhodanese-related sulfurtransferase
VTKVVTYWRAGRVASIPVRSRNVWSPHGQLLFVGPAADPFRNGSLRRQPLTELDDFLTDPCLGAALDGIAYGWKGSGLDEVLARQDASTVSMQVRADGVASITANTLDGDISALLGGNGFRELRSMEVRWTERMFYREKRLRDWGLRRVALKVENCEFDQLASAAVPTRGVVTIEVEKLAGHVECRTYKVRRTNVRLNPDTAGLRRGDLGLPDDFTIDSPDHPQISLEYRAGKLLPKYDQLCFARLAERLGYATQRARIAASSEHEHGLFRDAEALPPPPLCGVLCVYGLSVAAGVPISHPESLVSERYVGGLRGSSPLDLVIALRETAQCRAVVRHGMTASEAMDGTPRILFTRAAQGLQSPDHYVLAAGIAGPFLRALDPSSNSSACELWTEAYLGSRWNGVAIELASEQDDWASFRARVSDTIRFRGGVTGALLVALIGAIALRAFCRRHGKPVAPATTAWQEAILLALVAGAAMLSYQTTVMDASQSAVRGIRTQIASPDGAVDVPRVRAGIIRQSLDSSGIQFIDARPASDFVLSRLPGAISIPVSAVDADVDKATCGLQRCQLLVVYCQSAECRFAEAIASRLLQRGFLNMVILDEGIEGWRTAGGT